MAANNIIISINTKMTIKMFARNNRIIVKESFAKFGHNSEICSQFRNLVKVQKFGQNSETILKFLNFVEIQKFG